MSDDEKLIERLRYWSMPICHEAADALTRLRAKAAHAHAAVALGVEGITRLREENARQAAEIERKNAALKPFAKAADRWNDPPGCVTHDNVKLWQRGERIDYLTVGDLRRASAALTQEPTDEGR